MSSPESFPQQNPRAAGKPWQVIVGTATIFLGSVLGLLMVRGLLLSANWAEKRSGWNIGGVFVFSLLAAFLIWIGSRAVRRGRGQIVPQPMVKWGRALGGVWLVFFAFKSHFAPDPNAYQADNTGQAFGMFMATVFMLAAGVFLIVTSLKPLWRTRNI
jgi:hypothetical protein